VVLRQFKKKIRRTFGMMAVEALCSRPHSGLFQMSPKLLYLENIVLWLSLPIFYEQIAGLWGRGFSGLEV